MSEQKVTDEFGVMKFISAEGVYETSLEVPNVGVLRVSVAAEEFESGVEQISAFLAWLRLNHQRYKLSLELEIQDYDLVWDDVWNSILGNEWVDAEEGFLAEYLSYESVEFRHGTVRVWIDTAGLHTDHKIRATMNRAMQIQCCELM